MYLLPDIFLVIILIFISPQSHSEFHREKTLKHYSIATLKH